MPQQIKVEHVGKPRYRVDRFGRRYICVRRAPNVWDVGLATARKWLAQGVSWRDVRKLTTGQRSLFKPAKRTMAELKARVVRQNLRPVVGY